MQLTPNKQRKPYLMPLMTGIESGVEELSLIIVCQLFRNEKLSNKRSLNDGEALWPSLSVLFWLLLNAGRSSRTLERRVNKAVTTIMALK